MRVELLAFAGCPNAGVTKDRLRDALSLEACAASVHYVEVNTPELAETMQFLGSPTVRVNGVDVEASAADRRGYGLACRTYRDASGTDGAPSVDMLRRAIREL
jgi:hypothetical protein